MMSTRGVLPDLGDAAMVFETTQRPNYKTVYLSVHFLKRVH